MNKIHLMQKIKEIYRGGGNIIEYLRTVEEQNINSLEDILISYDFQAGNYFSAYKENPAYFSKQYDEMTEILNTCIEKCGGACTILEAGVGEGRSLVSILNRMDPAQIKKAYGFDVSWSRIKYAEKFEEEFGKGRERKISFFTSDLLNIAVKDSAIDIVFTVHAAEPNGGKEKNVLEELYRITGKYLVMFEPAYEFASDAAKKRMEHHRYITRLYESAVELEYTVIKHELLKNLLDPMNPTGVLVIEKKQLNQKKYEIEDIFCDPILKEDMRIEKNEYYCEKSMLAYPVLGGVPCLLADNAIVATKYNEFN